MVAKSDTLDSFSDVAVAGCSLLPSAVIIIIYLLFLSVSGLCCIQQTVQLGHHVLLSIFVVVSVVMGFG